MEGVGASGIIQTGSPKSWLLLSAHVVQTFHTFRNKFGNIKRYSVRICLLIKEALLETAKMSGSGVKNGLEVALLTRSDRQRMVYRLWNRAKDRICQKAHLDLLSFYFSNNIFLLSIRIL